VASASTVLPPQPDARMERSGTQRWLVVKATPDQVWPVVKDFWQEIGMVVNVEMPDAGVMETDWAESRAKVPDGWLRNTLGRVLDSMYSTSERDKFRTRLERGAQAGTTEIYISHRGMEEVYISSERDQTKWQPRRPDPDIEAEMLGRLMARFGVTQDKVKAQVAVAAQAPRATLSGNTGTLAVHEQFDRAWRRVGLALDRVGFTVEDRDRSKGLFFVRYIDPDSDQKKDTGGFMDKLAFWKAAPKSSQPQYRIHVSDAGASMSQVLVQDAKGTPESGSTGRKILGLLFEQLK
jgi:outer membrane protein assembly factor BamC